MACNCNGADILRSIDVKLNVQLVYVGLVHEYAYEGPCRFGPPETLTKEFDQFNQAEIFKGWSGAMMGAFGAMPGIMAASTSRRSTFSQTRRLEQWMAEISVLLCSW